MRGPRKSTCYFAVMTVLAAAFVAMFSHSRHRQSVLVQSIDSKARMVRELGLTDLCLFTEASYTRHITQTDLRTPFQDHPMSLEHFPSGSLVTPPVEPKRTHAKNG